MEIIDIFDKHSLADFLCISTKYLNYILYEISPNEAYRSFAVPKKSGGVRLICAPNKRLKKIQCTIAKALNDIYIKDYVCNTNNIPQGFIPGRSIITNAKIHKHKKYIINLDLENFFESIHFGRVCVFFVKNKSFLLPQTVATMLAHLLCFQGKLPQGAPTSPVMTNLICAILDRRLTSLAAKYHLQYTRYADDLTFSTNDPNILNCFDIFIKKVNKIIINSGFIINQKKTSLRYFTNRQIVTGLVVNNRIHVKKEFVKETWSMADYLYRDLPVMNNGKQVNINQLEGRFSFINQLDKYNNTLPCNKKLLNSKLSNKKMLNRREKLYRRFIFYKLFYSNPKPLIIVEGKTDSIYIKCAMAMLQNTFPRLVQRTASGDVSFSVNFLNFSDRIKYFLALQEGSSSFDKLLDIYKNGDDLKVPSVNDYNEQIYNYLFSISNKKPLQPVVLLYDNEQKTKNKPLYKLIKGNRLSENMINFINEKSWCYYSGNLFIATIPLFNEKSEIEIEDLFPESVLMCRVNGKSFARTVDNPDTQFGKGDFAKYILKNKNDIDFGNFNKLLNVFNEIIQTYYQML